MNNHSKYYPAEAIPPELLWRCPDLPGTLDTVARIAHQWGPGQETLLAAIVTYRKREGSADA